MRDWAKKAAIEIDKAIWSHLLDHSYLTKDESDFKSIVNGMLESVASEYKGGYQCPFCHEINYALRTGDMEKIDHSESCTYLLAKHTSLTFDLKIHRIKKGIK